MVHFSPWLQLGASGHAQFGDPREGAGCRADLVYFRQKAQGDQEALPITTCQLQYLGIVRRNMCGPKLALIIGVHMV